MKLSLYSSVIMNNFYAEPDEALKHAYDAGVTAMEIFDNELGKRALSEYCNYVGQYGIELYGIVKGAFLSDKNNSVRERETDSVKKLIDQAAECKVTNIMVCPKIKKVGDLFEVRCLEDKLYVRDTIVEGMNKIVEYSKGSGVTITMENYSLNAYPYSTIDEMLYMMKNISGLKYTFDVGNFYCVKDDAIDAYNALKGYISNMHIKDWVLDEFGYCIRPEIPALNGCIIGEGVLPLKELSGKMKNDGLDCECVMELNTVEITKKDVENTVEFMKKHFS